MNNALRVLLVRDQDDDIAPIMQELSQAGYTVTFRRVATADRMQDALASPWDIVIADYQHEAFSALEALSLLKRHGLDIPFLIVSDTASKESAVQAMRSGAHDCLSTDDLARLGPAVERELREAIVRRERKQIDRAHRESENRFRKIFHASPLALAIGRLTDACLLDANQSFCELIGYHREEVYGHSMVNIGLWISNEEWSIFVQTLRTQYSIEGLEKMLHVRDGSVRELLVWLEMVELEGEPCVLCIFYDVTERRKAEERIHRQFQRMAALRRIQMSISASIDLNQTLDLLLGHITVLLNVDAAAVLLLQPQNQTLVYADGKGFRTTLVQQSRLPLGEGLAGYAALKRSPMNISDLRMSPVACERPFLLQEEGFLSYYGVPLIAKRQVKGVLELFHRTPMVFDQEWVHFLEALSGQAAIAIDNSELIEHLQQSRDQLECAYDATIEGWARVLDLRDKETEGHSQRVTQLTVCLAQAMGMSSDEIVHIRRGAFLHDIGKMGIPDSILLKPGSLHDEEWAVMRRHPEYAYSMLSPIEFLRPALDIPYCHHEKWDGSGYPRGLRGDEIPLSARIFAVVDVWDALSFDRPYRKAWPREQVFAHLEEGAGQHFDPMVVGAFLKMMREEPPSEP